MTSWRVLPLQKEHERQNFTCGSPALDRYLKTQARQDSDKRVAAVFALIKPPASQVQGYYTLSASTIHADEVPPELARKLPRYPQLSTRLPWFVLAEICYMAKLKWMRPTCRSLIARIP
jgi:hypothetical protein